MKISLIVIGVSDLAKSIAFYKDMAGFEFSNQHENLAFFMAGPIMVMLSAELRRPDGPLAGAMEVVVATDSVTATYQQLKARGANFIREPGEVTPGSWAAVFSDPDGHWLTLFGPK